MEISTNGFLIEFNNMVEIIKIKFIGIRFSIENKIKKA